MRENNSLGDKFAGFTSEPNPGVWENIERSLDKKPRRRGFGWLILVGCVFAGIIVWNFKGEAPQKTKYVSKENVTAKSSVQPQPGKKAENKIVKQGLLTSKIHQSLIQKRNPKTNQAGSAQSNLTSFNKIEEPNSSDGLIAEIKPSENAANDSIPNTLTEAPKDKLLSENDIPEETAPAVTVLPDSSALSQQDAEIGTVKTEPRTYRWQLQVQTGAFMSRKDEILVPPMNDPYFEGSGNVGSGGYLPITLGNSGTVKPYRSIITNYGVLASYDLVSRWRITSGFSYQRYYIYTLDDRTLLSGAHYIQIPVIADFKLLNKSRWEWSIGTGASLGYVFEKKSTGQFSSWRSDFIAQTSLRYALTQRILLQVQPQARFVFWDKEIGKAGKLSPWYWGGNVGAIWCF